MLQPRKTKYRKVQKGRNRGISNDTELKFGSFGLKAITRGSISSKQIESARRVITRVMKKQGFVWIRIFPDKPITKKPLEVRMGKGKGNVEYWISVIKPGKILYEIDGISKKLAQKAFRLAGAKLSVKTIFVIKDLLLWLIINYWKIKVLKN